MSKIVISFGSGGDERRKRDERNPYYKYLFCTCGQLCDDKLSVIMLGNGQMVNICKGCKGLLEAHQKRQVDIIRKYFGLDDDDETQQEGGAKQPKPGK